MAIAEPRSERVEVRTTPGVKALLQQAAASSNKNVTEFLLDAGLRAAEDVLGGQRLFRLDDDAWRVFQEVLDRPVTGRQAPLGPIAGRKERVGVMRGAEGLSPVEKLAAHHEVDAFDCGKKPLDRFLKRFALANQNAGSARTYVVCRRRSVVGYYSLAAGAVQPADAPPRVGEGLARRPIPVMLLARLAVDQSCQGQGLGKTPMKDALLRTDDNLLI